MSSDNNSHPSPSPSWRGWGLHLCLLCAKTHTLPLNYGNVPSLTLWMGNWKRGQTDWIEPLLPLPNNLSVQRSLLLQCYTHAVPATGLLGRITQNTAAVLCLWLSICQPRAASHWCIWLLDRSGARDEKEVRSQSRNVKPLWNILQSYS